jgi:SAM-dependent MidA family methyltransferase
MQHDEAGSVSAGPSPALAGRIAAAIDTAGGWLPFDRYMAMALYEPGLGYYARGARQFGHLPSSGSDFVTAPELSPLFGRTLARAVAQALDACGAREVWEFGGGSGALAAQMIEALAELGRPLARYTVVDLSATLRERQRERLAAHAGIVRWADALPERLDGVVVGNEVLDAMPVQLLHFDGRQWCERGVALADPPAAPGPAPGAPPRFAWTDRPTALRPPVEQAWPAGTVLELHLQAQAFVRTLAERMQRAAAFFIDYGFPEAEYYHPQRHQGTLLCHRAHQVDADPLADPGDKDITAHVDFTGIALAGQEAGLEVVGYTSQARFLVNAGIAGLLEAAGPRERADAQKLLTEHEMGELFKVIAFARGCDPAFTADPLGFAVGDRSHTL